ncbi:MAG: DMT family transporter [Betaproteobacteria bacterium]|nr:MAG: DMT family transporter [Betaproteobacteria bacterium]
MRSPPAVDLQSHVLRGVLWMLGAVLSFAAMAVAVRELQRHMGSFEILLLRSIVMLAIVGVMIAKSGTAAVRTQRLGLHVLRNTLHFAGQYFWVYSIGALALATVFAIEFTMPVWTALLAAMFLGERLNQGRIVQLVLGLAGVLIILRPGAGFFQLAALVMILGSMCYAATMVCTKRLSATDSPLAVLLWMSVVQMPIALVAAATQWTAPLAVDAPWILAIGTGSFTAHYCMTRAMTLADATVVVPIDFIRLPLIAVVGALFYAEPFDPMVIVGAAVIFVGTYYSLSRDKR